MAFVGGKSDENKMRTGGHPICGNLHGDEPVVENWHFGVVVPYFGQLHEVVFPDDVSFHVSTGFVIFCLQ